MCSMICEKLSIDKNLLVDKEINLHNVDIFYRNYLPG